MKIIICILLLSVSVNAQQPSLDQILQRLDNIDIRLNNVETQLTAMSNQNQLIYSNLTAQIKVVNDKIQPAGPSAWASIADAFKTVFTNQAVLGIAGTLAACIISKKC